MGNGLVKLGLSLLLFLTGCGRNEIQPIAERKNHEPKKDFVLKCFNRACQIVYKKEEDGEDYWQSPDETRKLGTGDCEDIALLLRDDLKNGGIESRVVWGVLTFDSNLFALFAKEKKPGEKTGLTGHGWIEYLLNNDIYVLDPVHGTIKRRKDILDLSYFEIVDESTEVKWTEYNKRLESGKGRQE